jgi:hypothetical protein
VNGQADTFRTTDRVAIGLAVLHALAVLIAAGAAYANLTRGNLVPGLAFILVALMFVLLGGVWWTRGPVELVVDADGLTRTGRHGWRVAWADVVGTTSGDVRSLAGSQVALVVKVQPQALTKELTALARVSRTLRSGLTDQDLVVAIPPALAGAVSSAIDSHAGGARS